MVSETSPIIMQHEDADQHYDEDDDVTNNTRWCGCFPLFFENRSETDRVKFLQQSGEYTTKESSWLIKKLKDMKEFSELVAGPKWKNFIRKFSKRNNNKKNNNQFQYDPQSYALNFNDGGDEEDDGFLVRNFSTRFAPPSTVVSSDQSRRPTGL